MKGLEDNTDDILAKACAGRGLPPAELARRIGCSIEDLGRAPHLSVAARELGLSPEGLERIATHTYRPEPGVVPGSLLAFTTPFGDMWVNAYLVFDPVSKAAAVFDTGSDADGLLDALSQLALKPTAIFLTHAHGDHIFDLDRLVEKTGAPAWSSEPVDGTILFKAPRVFEIGALRVEARATFGHSPCGSTYVVTGLSRPIAIVGDALFAGSIGGARVSYPDALRTVREEILTLPDDTLLCPGHGPFTTIGYEKAHNPFFAGL